MLHSRSKYHCVKNQVNILSNPLNRKRIRNRETSNVLSEGAVETQPTPTVSTYEAQHARSKGLADNKQSRKNYIPWVSSIHYYKMRNTWLVD